ncbi:MAG: cupredoxin domain-containing protein [bacterium]|nr:cupredoxin domain-containing protein [bacterium]
MDTKNPNEVKNNNLAIVIVIIIAVIIGWSIFNSKKKVSETAPAQNSAANVETSIADTAAPVKEFVMDSFYEMVDGQPKPQYSLKEITVNQGDLVRIKITVTKGAHDFKIDEYNVYADTQPNQQMTVEFTADKIGEFIYYCTKPGHRANGHWGTLKVLAK